MLLHLGNHYLIDLFDCDPALLARDAGVVDRLKLACKEGGLTVLDVSSHQFSPQGVTAIALLSTSHLAIHTWPEHGYAAVDLFICDLDRDALQICERLSEMFSAEYGTIRQLKRGSDAYEYEVFRFENSEKGAILC